MKELYFNACIIHRNTTSPAQKAADRRSAPAKEYRQKSTANQSLRSFQSSNPAATYQAT